MAVLILPDDMASATATRAIEDGSLRRVARGVVTDELDGPIENVVGMHLHELVSRLLPGAVITDRSAREGGRAAPGADGTQFLHVAHPERRRDLDLPGHVVAVRTGRGPVDGDLRHRADGLHLASQARALVDNARTSRARAGRPARTIPRSELEEWVEQLASRYTPDRFARLRTDVERVAHLLDEPDLGRLVSELMGAAQGTRDDVRLDSPALRARRAGVPVDRARVAMFDELAQRLRDRAPQPLPTTPAAAERRAMLPFFEAYFSNFIEGTEFTVAEAADIVLDGQIPEARPEDAHDVLGTYRLVSDEPAMSRIPSDDELVRVLQTRHAAIMESRPGANPGRFKKASNRVGTHVFVAPDEVRGTLRAGWERVRALDDAFARAVAAMFVIAEVHPFDDGNGRVARVMMNAELIAASETRIVIPTVYRNNYLAGLRAMSANSRADALVATLAFAQRWTSQIDWSSVEAATDDLERTHALRDPSAAEAEGLRLQLPG